MPARDVIYLGWPGDDTRLLAARWLTYAWTGDADNFRYPEGYVAGLEAEDTLSGVRSRI